MDTNRSDKSEQLLEAMFRHDDRGRIKGDAPRMHMLRTAGHVLVRFHADMPDETAAALERLASRSRGRPSAWAEEYAGYLSLVLAEATVTAVRAGPLYAFPDNMREATGCVTVDSSNLSLLSGALQEWQEDAEVGSLMVAALSDGRAVSVCSSVHASKFVHCAGVETAPEHRGFGFASLAVTGWASLVREHGAEPFYATTFDNIASQRVARSLGLSVVGSEFSIYGKALRQS